jgi:hypothetical protein
MLRYLTPYSLLDINQPTRGTCSIHLQVTPDFSFPLKMEGTGVFDILIAVYQATWRHIPEDNKTKLSMCLIN